MSEDKHEKILIFSAPSGSGKTTIVNRLLGEGVLNAEFSISATSRAPRKGEVHGREYYFLPPEEFRRRIDRGDFLEWEQVYADTYYGTLRSELSRIWAAGRAVILDVDVIGGLNIKRMYPQQALSIFIMPPSIGQLRARLEGRGTETPDKIDMRIAKAEREIAYSKDFDTIIVNDDLETAVAQARETVTEFLAK